MNYFNATILSKTGSVIATNVRVHANNTVEATMKVSNDPMWRNTLSSGGNVVVKPA